MNNPILFVPWNCPLFPLTINHAEQTNATRQGSLVLWIVSFENTVTVRQFLSINSLNFVPNSGGKDAERVNF
jgi:hypothetical protein